MEKKIYQVRNFDNLLSFSNGDKPDLESVGFKMVLKAGLKEKIESGIAKVLFQNQKIAIVYFPKYAPSRPYEAMICVFSQIENKPINNINILNSEEQKILFEYIFQAEKALIAVAKNKSHFLEEIYSFIHYGPNDLATNKMTKQSYNTSFTSLHFHIQGLGGHSLADFPEVFHQKNADFKKTEGARRITRDPSLKIMFEILVFLGYEASIKNSGSIAIEDSSTSDFSEIILCWNKIWHELAECFIDASDDAIENLLPNNKRLKMILDFCEKYQLSEHSQKILIFLAKKIKGKEQDEWMNFYKGPNGSMGFHLNIDSGKRKLLIAPRIFRSWMKHYPLMEPNEIVLKDEIGTNNPDEITRNFMIVMHKMILKELLSGKS